jgi:hypothetical protein
VIRDIANWPVLNTPVTVDFSGCGAEVRLAAQQLPGTVVGCAARTVTRITDAQGRVMFRIIGASSGAPFTIHGDCARIKGVDVYGTFTTLATVQASVYDLDGVSGLSAADLSLFLSDFYTGAVPPNYSARSDHNFQDGACSGREVTASDLSRWFDAFYLPGGTYAVPLCPQ